MTVKLERSAYSPDYPYRPQATFTVQEKGQPRHTIRLSGAEIYEDHFRVPPTEKSLKTAIGLVEGMPDDDPAKGPLMFRLSSALSALKEKFFKP